MGQLAPPHSSSRLSFTTAPGRPAILAEVLARAALPGGGFRCRCRCLLGAFVPDRA